MTLDYLQTDRARVARYLVRLRARAVRLLAAATIDDAGADEHDLGYYLGARRAHILTARDLGLILREGDLLAVRS